MEDNLKLLKSIVLITSPDQIEVEEWWEYSDMWVIGYGLYGETYFYIGIPMAKLDKLYYA